MVSTFLQFQCKIRFLTSFFRVAISFLCLFVKALFPLKRINLKSIKWFHIFASLVDEKRVFSLYAQYLGCDLQFYETLSDIASEEDVISTSREWKPIHLRPSMYIAVRTPNRTFITRALLDTGLTTSQISGSFARLLQPEIQPYFVPPKKMHAFPVLPSCMLYREVDNIRLQSLLNPSICTDPIALTVGFTRVNGEQPLLHPFDDVPRLDIETVSDELKHLFTGSTTTWAGSRNMKERFQFHLIIGIDLLGKYFYPTTIQRNVFLSQKLAICQTKMGPVAQGKYCLGGFPIFSERLEDLRKCGPRKDVFHVPTKELIETRKCPTFCMPKRQLVTFNSTLRILFSK